MKLPQNVIVKAPGLLPMMYTLREIGQELDVPDSTLRGWIQAGAPHQRDNRNHLWINGLSFSSWVKAQQVTKTHRKLAADEAYCLHCNQITKLVDQEVLHIKGKLIHRRGNCQICGKAINRGDRYDRKTKLS
jgi:hypothetical protein